MKTMQRFLAYYTAFEQTYLDNDWSRLEPLFHPDASYRIEGTGTYDCEMLGRDAIFAGIRRFLDGFDRHCTRQLEADGVPEVVADRVSFRGAAIYTRADSPPMRLELREEIEFGPDGRIIRMTDTYDGWDDGPPREIQKWLDAYGQGLSLRYV